MKKRFIKQKNEEVKTTSEQPIESSGPLEKMENYTPSENKNESKPNTSFKNEKVQKITRLVPDEKIDSIQKEKKKRTMLIVVSIFLFNYLNIFMYYCYVSYSTMAEKGIGLIISAINESFRFGKEIVLPIYLIALARHSYPPLWFIGGFLLGVVGVGIIWFVKFYNSLNVRTYRVGEEFGSAKKGDIAQDAYPLKAENNPKPERRDPDANIILSKNIQVDMDTRHTMLGNDNIFVIGGTGSGKTRFFVKPNLLQLAYNYVVIDPKGSVIRECGNAFKEAGYEIRVLNLVDFDKSMGYNPFDYFDSPEDVVDFVQNIIDNTQGKESGGDPFWTKAEMLWTTACIYYIMANFKGKPECNMLTLMGMLDRSEVKEDQEDFMSEIDALFRVLEIEINQKSNGRTEYNYAFLAVRNYKSYKLAAGKTAKSILISVATRLQHFNLPALRRIFQKDELHLDHIGNPMVKNGKHPEDLSLDIDRKTYVQFKSNEEYESLSKEKLRRTILFVIISDGSQTFSYIASIILQQLYKTLYRIADNRHDYRLPIHTRIINDEFATCGKQKEILNKIATMRSREISTTIIVQSIAQIKQESLYGQVGWEILFDCCSLTLFLGGVKGETTVNLIKGLAGKETVAYKTHSVTKGQSSSYTEGEQYTSADRYDYAKLTTLPNNRCLVHISGYQMFEDTKYDVMDHKNVNLTTDGELGESVAMDVFKLQKKMQDVDAVRQETFNHILLNDGEVDIEEYFQMQTGILSESQGNYTEREEVFVDNATLCACEHDMDKQEANPFMASLYN